MTTVRGVIERIPETWRAWIALGGAVMLGVSATLFAMGFVSLPERVDALEIRERTRGEFHDSVRIYMMQKDQQDERILCYLRSMANETSAVDCG